MNADVMHVSSCLQPEKGLLIQPFLPANLGSEGMDLQEVMDPSWITLVVSNHGFAKFCELVHNVPPVRAAGVKALPRFILYVASPAGPSRECGLFLLYIKNKDSSKVYLNIIVC